jgi:hypothetical protein
MLTVPLIDLVWSWQILADLVRILFVFFVDLRKKHLQTIIQEGCPKATKHRLQIDQNC